MVIAFNRSLGHEYGRPDIERLGIFVEMPYMNSPGPQFKSKNLKKDPTKFAFLSAGRKSRSGTQHGYFDAEFKRLFIGEYNSEYMKNRKKDTLATPFIVGYKGKKHATPGDRFGTFSGPIEHFGNEKRPVKGHPAEHPNFLGTNGKRGGPGVYDITINKFPVAMPDPYRLQPKHKQYGRPLAGAFVSACKPLPYFDSNPFYEGKPNVAVYIDRPKRAYGKNLAGPIIPIGPTKWQGGCHAGCFDKYPEFMPCRYISMAQANKPYIQDKGPRFNAPPFAEKSMFTSSIVAANTKFRVNNTNYKAYEPQYVRYLLNNPSSGGD